jgi:hypothetical protein
VGATVVINTAIYQNDAHEVSLLGI